MTHLLAAIQLQGFLAQAFFYLLAAVVSVPMARKLGMGSVLGYLVAGVCLGPWVLKVVGGEGKDVMHFAEFGVVMMLFVVGLELKPSLLWRLRGPILGLGGSQVLLTGIAAAGALVALGWSWREALAAGFIASMSSTAIVIQSLAEKGQLKTNGGQAAFSVLLFQDLAVIPLLALLPLLAAPGSAVTSSGGSGLPGWQMALLTLGAVAGVVALGRFLLRPIFRIIARSKSRETFTATALLLVIGSALLLQSVGLSPAMGTFLAGLVLADSEFRHELESNIEPFKGLLLGIFFIAVGAAIDFGLIISQPGYIFALTVGLIILKWAVLYILGMAFRQNAPTRDLFSLALAQVGEFAFVLFSVAEAGHVLPADKTAPLIAATALSMAATPLLLLFHDRVLARRHTKKHSVRKPDEIDEHDNPVIIAGFGRFGHIVGRLLQTLGVRTTIIDLDPDQVELFRKLGMKVFYGDASREDILHAAGAANAKLFVLATDDEARSLEIVDTVRRHFPNLKILARSYGRLHSYELMKRGVNEFWRETLDSSLELGIHALRHLGFRAYEARRAAQKFRRYDEETLRRLAPLYGDTERYIAAARQSIETMNRVFQEDRTAFSTIDDSGWDTETLEDEVRGKSAPGAARD